jgi:hypothetical protein
MVVPKPFPCVNNPARVIGFLIFAIDWFVTLTPIGNKHDPQTVLAGLNDLKPLFLATAIMIAPGDSISYMAWRFPQGG